MSRSAAPPVSCSEAGQRATPREHVRNCSPVRLMSHQRDVGPSTEAILWRMNRDLTESNVPTNSGPWEKSK